MKIKLAFPVWRFVLPESVTLTGPYIRAGGVRALPIFSERKKALAFLSGDLRDADRFVPFPIDSMHLLGLVLVLHRAGIQGVVLDPTRDPSSTAAGLRLDELFEHLLSELA